MLRESDVTKFLDTHNYDLRISKNGRWIDQKCTPDVLNVVADCILEASSTEAISVEFTSVDIWHSQYAEENVRDIFSKPSTSETLSKNEYDKFFAQPLEMLANAGVLNKSKRGRKNYYTVQNEEILEFISLREKNSLVFIFLYCEKVLKDSGMWSSFEDFFNVQTTVSYDDVKQAYETFIINNTPINGVLEARRIFTKVINPLAYRYKKLGTSRGRLSRHPITYSELMYNRENFRDINSDKPKGVTRQEWMANKVIKINISYYKYQSNKAKKFLRKFNNAFRNGLSEFNGMYSDGPATQIHHIFPEHEYPEISMFLENLIALTPTQHLTQAHPNNHTNKIDLAYQELLLKAKASNIEENLTDDTVETIYSFEQFVTVLKTGFDSDIQITENDFVSVMNIINSYYMEN